MTPVIEVGGDYVNDKGSIGQMDAKEIEKGLINKKKRRNKDS